jgi:pimeloyl-ACP methyl ester carboxylesterase
VTGLRQVSTESDECTPGVLRSRPQARIRVQRLEHPGGGRSWIVSVPGTRTWSALAGPNPLDLTGNVRAMAQQRTAAGAAVLAAMRQAGVGPGEPVLLAGHSQGGLVAADLAADPVARREFDITHLVTAGSPIARDQIPADVEVLALEHDDLVPRLDGAPNPAGPNWVTVSRPASADPQLRAVAADSPMPGHSLAGYARTAALVDASSNPSLLAWRRGAAAFLAGPAGAAEVRVYDAERVLR